MNLLTPLQQELVTELRRMFGRGPEHVAASVYYKPRYTGAGIEYGHFGDGGSAAAIATGPDDTRITDRLDVVIALLWDINQKIGEKK